MSETSLPTNPSGPTLPPSPISRSGPAAIPVDVREAPASAQFGKFTRTQRLGAGGMGEVWKAWDHELGRWVALKFLKAGDDDEIARFKREAQLAGQLNHANIAAIYDVGFAQDRWFIAMQFVAGRTLKAQPRGDRRALVGMVRDATRAIAFAHAQGIIHRDVKPENIMIEGDRVFVMDFGLARPVEGGQSVSGTIVGTPAYMPPEQARGDAADARSDVYSLGATLYDLLTAVPPFQGGAAMDILLRVCEQDPRPPRRLDPTIDADLETIVLKCLEKDRAQRYQSAGELCADLDRWLAGEPVIARPISAAERLWRKVKRNRALSLAIITAFLVAIVGSVTVVIQRQRAASALQMQEQTAKTALWQKEAERLQGEERLKRLAGLWMRILDRKRDLKKLEVPATSARPALQQAVAAVEAFAAEHPTMPQAWYLKGRGWMYLDEPVKAETAARKAVEIAPDFTPGWRLLGMALLQQAQLQSIVMRGGWEDPRRRGRDELAKEGVEAIRRGSGDGDEEMKWGLPRTTEDDVLARVADALRLVYADQRGIDGVRLLERAMSERKAEEFAIWRGLLGGDRDQRAWFDRAVEWAPGDSFALFYRGLLKQWSQDPAGAILDFNRAIEVRSDFAIVHLSRGHARKDTGDRAGGFADYARAAEIRPDFTEAYLATIALHTAAREWQAALPAMGRVLELRPEWAQGWLMRAEARFAMRDLQGTVQDTDQAIKLDASNPVAWYIRANAKRDLADAAGAMADFTRAIELNPKFAEALANRGLLRESRGDYANAAADVEEALRMAPENWTYREAAQSWLKRIRSRR